MGASMGKIGKAEREAADASLDRLADLGLSALMREVVEPMCAAILARAGPEMASKPSALAVFADYWSAARALSTAFEEPEIARRCAAMFFARAPQSCHAWAGSEQVEGRTRLRLRELDAFVKAATQIRDGNPGAFSAELIDSMVGRQSESAEAAMAAALAYEPALRPRAVDALSKDLKSGFIWPSDSGLDGRLDAFVDFSRESGGVDAGDMAETLDQVEAAAESRRCHALAVGFGVKLAARLAREPGALGMDKARWDEMVDRLVDWCDLARRELLAAGPMLSNGSAASYESAAAHKLGQATREKAGVSAMSEYDRKLMASSATFVGGARERLASELALGALERAAEPGGDAASAALLGAFRELFWGRGLEMGPEATRDKFKAMAQAVANRLCRDGAAACLAPEAARELYESMATFEPRLPAAWSAATRPDTVAWLCSATGELVDGARMRELATMARDGALSTEREAQWVEALGARALSLDLSEPSLREARSAKDMAKTLRGGRAIGAGLVAELGRLGVPDGEALERLQDLLGALPALGAADSACARAQDAMAEALAVLESESLASALAVPAPWAPRARSRL